MSIEFAKGCPFLTSAVQTWLRKQIQNRQIMIAEAIRYVTDMQARWHLDAAISYWLPQIRDGHSYRIEVRIEHNKPTISIEAIPPEDVVGVIHLAELRSTTPDDTEDAVLDALHGSQARTKKNH